jgi:hypothetical protein
MNCLPGLAGSERTVLQSQAPLIAAGVKAASEASQPEALDAKAGRTSEKAECLTGV